MRGAKHIKETPPFRRRRTKDAIHGEVLSLKSKTNNIQIDSNSERK